MKIHWKLSSSYLGIENETEVGVIARQTAVGAKSEVKDFQGAGGPSSLFLLLETKKVDFENIIGPDSIV